jgi:hypothetical protein
VTAVFLTMALLAAAATTQAAPMNSPPLNEVLSCGENFALHCPPGGGPVVTNASCNVAGDSKFDFQVSGFASGTYTGTFTETGTLTIGPRTPNPNFGNVPTGQVTDLSASFVINSDQGVITGHKQMTQQTSGFFANICVLYPGASTPSYGAFADSPNVCYSARLPDGTRDTGRTSVQIGTFGGGDQSATPPTVLVDGGFLEGLGSDATVSCGQPTTKADCMNGGYQTFGFANQGQCIKALKH